MDWDHLRILLAIHRSGSLRGAADALGVSHATVARGLEAAERSLGTRIFDRSSRGMSATAPGETLIPYAETVERNVLEVQRRITGLDAQPTGTVRVSLPPAFGHAFFADLLATFSARHPGIDVHVVATNAISDLSRQEADVSLRAARQIDDDLVGRRLTDYVTAAYAAPTYLAAYPNLVATCGDGAHWIGWGDDGKWIANTPLPRAVLRHALPEVLMQAEAAVAGLGLAWLPTFLANPIPGLVRVPGTPTGTGRSIWILLHGDLRRTARVRAFVDHAVEWIATRRTTFRE